MGLKICYELTATTDVDTACEMVRTLHAGAHQIGFDEITPVRRIDACDPLIGVHFTHTTVGGAEVPLDIPALGGAWFWVYTDGAESMSVGLASRPATVDAEGIGSLPTGLEGRCTWMSSCKTQYADLPEHGGEPNFLRAHLAVCDLLDEAAALGVDVDVADDGGYWEHRDADLLLDELRRWNGMMAAFAGFLTDAFRDQLGRPVAPIFGHPSFERLEAEGRAQLGWDE